MSEVLFNRIASEEGWAESTQIVVLLRYIENQNAPDAFLEYLDEQRAEHVEELEPVPGDSFLWALSDFLQHAALALDPDFQEFCGNVFDTLTIEQAATLWRERQATR